MAKIENTTVYPTVTPAASDLLIGTDVNDSNKTVTFTVADIVGAGSVAQDLNSVLTTGNTSALSIVLTGNITCVGLLPTTISAQGSVGTAGQYLTSTGTGLQWINPPTVAVSTLQETLTAGNTTTLGINMNGSDLIVSDAGGGITVNNPAFLTVSGLTTFTNTVSINGSTLNFDATGLISDGAGSTGTAGQWLAVNSAATGLEWSNTLPASAVPTLQQVLTAGNTAASIGMTFSGTGALILGASNDISSSGSNTYSGNNRFTAVGDAPNTAALYILGTVHDATSIGTAGQIFTATGTGWNWAAPAVQTNTLQQVLDTGNSATGANASITLSGTITPATVTDGSGSTGTVGQVLSSTGTGLQWTATGTGAVTNISAVTDVSNGVPLSVSSPTGVVVLTSHYFEGGANVGYVPSSAASDQSTTFLRADGLWQVPSGLVTSVSLGLAPYNTSVGAPLELGSTVGGVVIKSLVFDGGANVGAVPSSAAANQSLDFLRADGTWQPPAAQEQHGSRNILLLNGTSSQTYVSGTEYARTKINTNNAYGMNELNNEVAPGSPLVNIDFYPFVILTNPIGNGSCNVTYPNYDICLATMGFFCNTDGTYRFNLYKLSYTNTGSNTPVLAASAVFTSYVANTAVNITFSFEATTDVQKLAPGESYGITYQQNYSATGLTNFGADFNIVW